MSSQAPAPQGRVCWICLGNEIEPESADAGPFIKLCSCTLQSHESCLLQWMLASRKPAPACPQCGTKFVAVKKRQGLGLLVLGVRKMLAAAAFFGVSFVVFRSVGSAYVRAVYDPVHADRILGVLPIPGLTPWANAVVKAFNSVVVAGIPFVLLRRPKLSPSMPDQAVEPPLLSLAMMLVARLEPQPVGWVSLSVAGLVHSAYRLTMDTFVMPRYGIAPVEVSEVPDVPAVLNLGRENYDEDVLDIQQLHVREREIDREVRRSSAQLAHMFDHSHRINDLLLEVVYTVVHNILRDSVARNDARTHAGPDTPNESDATESEEDDASEDGGPDEGSGDVRPENEYVHANPGPPENDVPNGPRPRNADSENEDEDDEPLLPESHVLTLFLVVNADGTPDDFQDWSNDYTELVRSLVHKMRYGETGEDLNALVEAEVWKLVYWQPIRFLTSHNSREQRKAVLLHTGGPVLNTLRSLASADNTSWDHAPYEYLLEPMTAEGTAEYICEWIERRREQLRDPLHDLLVNEMINGIAEVDAEAAALLGGEDGVAGNAVAVGNRLAQPRPRSAEYMIEWEQAAPVLLYPFCSIFVSSVLKTLWPVSLLPTMHRNLVAGGLVIVTTDLTRIVLSTLQHRGRKQWHLTRFDDLDEQTRQLLRMQENVAAM